LLHVLHKLGQETPDGLLQATTILVPEGQFNKPS
jgi:hypothetical protein